MDLNDKLSRSHLGPSLVDPETPRCALGSRLAGLGRGLGRPGQGRRTTVLRRDVGQTSPVGLGRGISGVTVPQCPGIVELRASWDTRCVRVYVCVHVHRHMHIRAGAWMPDTCGGVGGPIGLPCLKEKTCHSKPSFCFVFLHGIYHYLTL